MSFEQNLVDELNNESEIVSVRKLALLGKSALLDRVDALSTLSAINSHAEIGPEVKAAGKRHELEKHLAKSRVLDAAIADAEADVVRNTPPIPAADGSSSAVDQELRAHFRNSNENVRNELLKNSDAMRMAVARAPRELSGLGETHYAQLRDNVLRATYPEKMAARDADRRVIEAARTARSVHRQTAKSSFGVEIETHATVLTIVA